MCVLRCFRSVWLFVTPWTVASQVPISMGFSRQVYWSGLPCLSPGDLLDPECEPASPAAPAWQVYFFFFFYHWATGEALMYIHISSVQSFSHVRLFATLWTAAPQASLSTTNTQSFLSSCPSSQCCHPTISSSELSLSSCLNFPNIRIFPMSQFITSGDQSVGTSSSVLPMNIQDWFPLDWVVWSPCSPRDFQESFRKPQFKSINSSVLSFLYGPPISSIPDNWKKP